MKRSKSKIWMAGIGLMSLAVFFWFFMYQMFINTRADSKGIHAFFDKSRILTPREGAIDVNVYLLSQLDEHISAGTIILKYPPSLMHFVSTLDEQNRNPSNQTQTECANSNYRLTKVLDVKDDTVNGILKITRLAISKKESLPSGVMCFGTVTFLVDKSAKMGSTGTITFSDTSKWDFVGPENSYKLLDNGRNTLQVEITNQKGRNNGR